MESKGPAPHAAHNTQQSSFGTVFAFDFGELRIGVAVGELELGIAHPLETIDAAANDARFARIAALLQEWRPVLLVVGLPLALDGTEHRLTGLARKFAQRLHGRFGIETRLIDERLTSVEAQRDARASGLTARESKRHVDPLAAKLILEAFFNENA
ncbi:MAG TPA: Holliday junction resolvase RuvX [Burkholderiales bacterium]|nr:Holliday junction resolvase RuvX [Burkholderiales bacterium]